MQKMIFNTLKISGIWETEQMIGVTFKFILNSD